MTGGEGAGSSTGGQAPRSSRGPRAGQFLIAGGKAIAAMDGRPAVTLADIRKVAVPVLRHRISTNFQAQAEGVDSVAGIRRLIESVPEPSVPKYE